MARKEVFLHKRVTKPGFPYPKHECGIFGVFGHPRASELTYYGLYALQHRGQESAGIAASEGPGKPFRVHKGMGLVSQVFDSLTLRSLQGSRAIGHVRYSTTGSSLLKNAQPIVVSCARGQLAIAHNGNLVNAGQLRDELEAKGSIFQTTTDSEIILHLLAQPAEPGEHQGLLRALRRIRGAFSLVLLTENALVAARDPFGFRPLSLGTLEDAVVISSETCAFDLIHARWVRDLAPGEVLIVTEEGQKSLFPYSASLPEAFCVFEFVYFARPDSNLLGKNVSQVRVQMGIELAREHPVEADLVIPVPDSGIYAALGYAQESKIPFYPAFVRNHYIGRTFLQPTQLIRDFSVRIKLNLIDEAIRDKRVVVVDDSVVRGTTARGRIMTLREAGAREVHLRISCPPHRYACYYGIDFPDPSCLLANQMDLAQIQTYLGVDSLGYLSVEGMIRACGLPANRFCTACFTGCYPLPPHHPMDKFVLERRPGSVTPLLVDDEPMEQPCLL
ncbi:amidophosphoribosyltransferase [Candidatus Methylacidithermus pantelleriae]|uniref:amidophosphoribosyltransferase n=1 Tax=Candidatus Methylacidithermus pantelleriae TaxID=2744239 RepID=UPI001F23316C|nr:amidophosphoribosyltransferase [Candidatus Methylacidithermus pantelleriae]